MSPAITRVSSHLPIYDLYTMSPIITQMSTQLPISVLYTMPAIITEVLLTCLAIHQSSPRIRITMPLTSPRMPISGLYTMPAIITELPHSPAYIRVIHNASNHHRGPPLTCLYPGYTQCQQSSPRSPITCLGSGLYTMPPIITEDGLYTMPPIITEDPDYTQCHQSSPRIRIIHNATNHHRGSGLYTMPQSSPRSRIIHNATNHHEVLLT